MVELNVSLPFQIHFFWQIGLKKCNNCYFNDVKMELRELKTVVEKKSTIKRILLVDDSPTIHKLLRRTLEAHGYEVCGDAKNGREAVSMYQSLKPDLVFMDITMPVMDGLGSLRGNFENGSPRPGLSC